jgi:hypothetical protein
MKTAKKPNPLFKLNFPKIQLKKLPPKPSTALVPVPVRTQVVQAAPPVFERAPSGKTVFSFGIERNGEARSFRFEKDPDGRLKATTSIEIEPGVGDPMSILPAFMGTFGSLLPGGFHMGFGNGGNSGMFNLMDRMMAARHPDDVFPVFEDEDPT